MNSLKTTIEDIMKIEGFAKITSTDIVGGLKKEWPTIKHMRGLGFNLSKTPLIKESEIIKSPISGMKVVFTGVMIHGSRDQMKKDALNLGAKVQSLISPKTDILICGNKVGTTKIRKAEKLSIKIMSEKEYFALLQNR